jgi:hypothetical protein
VKGALPRTQLRPPGHWVLWIVSWPAGEQNAEPAGYAGSLASAPVRRRGYGHDMAVAGYLDVLSRSPAGQVTCAWLTRFFACGLVPASGTPCSMAMPIVISRRGVAQQKGTSPQPSRNHWCAVRPAPNISGRRSEISSRRAAVLAVIRIWLWHKVRDAVTAVAGSCRAAAAIL